ncbi:hypothetical protein Sgou_51330 [Streptomyces gougerotii]|uniref:Antitoxin n=2 Tax=Streptomyces diastaticus group TaxID=2849069 RepID=A0A6A0CTI8_9ACTN|nr:hypothetical protein Sgou_31760 [Streptomyces gougerotii]GFH80463.1 hypothetical protein Sgou_51330 [Streptomyces gougerotii]GGU71350.1 hypothetical protein GCM10010227_27000 [Streptomyces gougerotii]
MPYRSIRPAPGERAPTEWVAEEGSRTEPLPRRRAAHNRTRTLPFMPEHQERASDVARAAMEAVENSVSVREARAHLAQHINRAESGTPTVVTRNGAPVAALVPFADFEVLEEAADLMLAREAEAVLSRDEPTVSLAELVADLFSGRTDGPA